MGAEGAQKAVWERGPAKQFLGRLPPGRVEPVGVGDFSLSAETRENRDGPVPLGGRENGDEVGKEDPRRPIGWKGGIEDWIWIRR